MTVMSTQLKFLELLWAPVDSQVSMDSRPRKSLLMAHWDRFNEGLFYEWSICTKGVVEHKEEGN